jgi:hypothetical protein
VTGLYNDNLGLGGRPGLSQVAGLWSGVSGFASGAYGPNFILGSSLAVWHDNQDLSTMFSDFVGTPAVIGGQVALQLDKSQGGALGSELITNGDFASGASWSAPITGSSITGGALVFDGVTSLASSLVVTTNTPTATIVAGKVYVATYTINSPTTNPISLSVGANAGTPQTAAGTYTEYLVATDGTAPRILTRSSTGVRTGSVDNISVREVLGSPRYQTTTAQRPILGRHPKGGRRNLLTYTEDFSNGVWTPQLGASATAGGTLTFSADPLSSIRQYITTISGAVTISVDVKSSGQKFSLIMYNATDGTVTSPDITPTSSWVRYSYTFYPTVTASNFYISNASDGVAGSIDVRNAQLELGSTATAYQKVTTTYDCTQAGVADCYFLQADGSDDGMVTPTLNLNGITIDGQAVRNLLRASENFTDAVWTKSNCTVTANADGFADLVVDTGSSALTQSVTVTPNTNYVFSFLAKKGSATSAKYFIWNSTAGATIVAATEYISQINVSDYVRVSVPFTTPAGCTAILVDPYRSSTGSAYLTETQLELGSTATTYQKRGTDKIGVFTAVRKLSDAGLGMLVEFSATDSGNNGMFSFLAPTNAATPAYQWRSKGTIRVEAGTASTFAAPVTNVLTAIGDISGDVATLRANGTQAATSATDQGTGNYGNYQLFYFRRGGSSLPYNGLEYGNVISASLPTADQITNMENYYNGIVGAY